MLDFVAKCVEKIFGFFVTVFRKVVSSNFNNILRK